MDAIERVNKGSKVAIGNVIELTNVLSEYGKIMRWCSEETLDKTEASGIRRGR